MYKCGLNEFMPPVLTMVQESDYVTRTPVSYMRSFFVGQGCTKDFQNAIDFLSEAVGKSLLLKTP